MKKLEAFLKIAAKANSAKSRLIATATFNAVKSLSPKLTRPVLDLLGGREGEVLDSLWSSLSLDSFVSAPEAFRLVRAQAAQALAGAPWQPDLKEQLASRIRRDVQEEKSPVVKQAYVKAA